MSESGKGNAPGLRVVTSIPCHPEDPEQARDACQSESPDQKAAIVWIKRSASSVLTRSLADAVHSESLRKLMSVGLNAQASKTPTKTPLLRRDFSGRNEKPQIASMAAELVKSKSVATQGAPKARKCQQSATKSVPKEQLVLKEECESGAPHQTPDARAVDGGGADAMARKGVFSANMPQELNDACLTQGWELTRAKHIYTTLLDAAEAAGVKQSVFLACLKSGAVASIMQPADIPPLAETVAPETWIDLQIERYKDDSIIADMKRMFELISTVYGRLATKSFRIPYITKSCHQCQYQGVWYLCQCDDPTCEHNRKLSQSSSKAPPSAQACSLYVCHTCIQEHYAVMGISAEELRRICPVCRGVCICRRHLRIPVQMPALHAQRSRQLSQLSAALLVPDLKACFKKWQTEADHSGIYDLCKIPHVNCDRERILCSRCQTCISNIYRTCKRCGTDLCVRCCGDVRLVQSHLSAPGGAGAPVTDPKCPNPTCSRPSSMGLQRLLTAPHIKDLQALIHLADGTEQQAWRTVDGVTHASGMLVTQPRDLLFKDEHPPKRRKPPGTAGVSCQPTAAAAEGPPGTGTGGVQPNVHSSDPAAPRSTQPSAAAYRCTPVKASAAPSGPAQLASASAVPVPGTRVTAPHSLPAPGPNEVETHGAPCGQAHAPQPPPQPPTSTAAAASAQVQHMHNAGIQAPDTSAPDEGMAHRLRSSTPVKAEPCTSPPKSAAQPEAAVPAAAVGKPSRGTRRATARLSEVSPSLCSSRPGSAVAASPTQANTAHQAAAAAPAAMCTHPASPAMGNAPANTPAPEHRAIKVEDVGGGLHGGAGAAGPPSPCSVAAPTRRKSIAPQPIGTVPPATSYALQFPPANSQHLPPASVAAPLASPSALTVAPSPISHIPHAHCPPLHPGTDMPQYVMNLPPVSVPGVPRFSTQHVFHPQQVAFVTAGHAPKFQPVPRPGATIPTRDSETSPAALPVCPTNGMQLPDRGNTQLQTHGNSVADRTSKSAARRASMTPGSACMVRRPLHRPPSVAANALPVRSQIAPSMTKEMSQDDVANMSLGYIEQQLAGGDALAASSVMALQRARGAAASESSSSAESRSVDASDESCLDKAAADSDANVPVLRSRRPAAQRNLGPELEAASSPDEADLQHMRHPCHADAACATATGSRQAPRDDTGSDDDGAPPPKRRARTPQASPGKAPAQQQQSRACGEQMPEKRARSGSRAVSASPMKRAQKRSRAAGGEAVPAGAPGAGGGPQSPSVTKRKATASSRMRLQEAANRMVAPGYIADSFTASRSPWAPTEEEAATSRSHIPTAFVRGRAGGLTAEQWSERLRLASWTHDASKGECYLLCVDSAELRAATDPNGAAATGLTAAQAADVAAVFWQEWSSGKPVLVKNIRGQISWEPKCMRRATTELGNKKAETVKDVEFLRVQRCDTWEWQQMRPTTFFNAYAKRDTPGSAAADPDAPLLKLKDYPPSASFASVLPRHLQDFLGMLPVPHMTRTDSSTLNLATTLGDNCVPTDLGPKCYIALGRPEERGPGDSVTRCHLDMSDAINVMLHVPEPPTGPSRTTQPWQLPGYQGAGAVWHIWRREDLDKLRRFMRANQRHFPDVTTASGHVELADWEDPVHSQRFMLSDALLQKLLEETGVQPWQFEQNLGEAVFIPAGCAHQVRNLMSSIKVAVDFVSPHNIGLCLHMAQEMRAQRNTQTPLKDVYTDQEFDHQDSLQAETILVHGGWAMYKQIVAEGALAGSPKSKKGRK